MKMSEVFKPKGRKSIIVTIPKSKLREVEAEEAEVAVKLKNGEGEGICYYWEMGRLPAGWIERIYFVWDGAIRAYHEVTDVDRQNKRIYMKTEINEIEPIPMDSFRGYRYYEET